MTSKEISVSILCLAYNHEKYIEECLNSLLSQKCNFNYEILINDDASTDKTASIIKKYENKYPDIIKPIYQQENLYSKGTLALDAILMSKAKGKYIALCECDDKWIDENKLQLQYDALEQNVNCNLCVHNVLRIKEDGNSTSTGCVVDSINEGVLSPVQLLSFTYHYNFQTSSYFMRTNKFKKLFIDNPKYKQLSAKGVGDIIYLLHFVSIGDSFYINKTMSAYRLGSESSTTTKWQNNIDRVIEIDQAAINVYAEFNNYTNHLYDQECNRIINKYEMMMYLHSKDYKTVSRSKYKKDLLDLGLDVYLICKIKASFPRISKFLCKVLKREY